LIDVSAPPREATAAASYDVIVVDVELRPGSGIGVTTLRLVYASKPNVPFHAIGGPSRACGSSVQVSM